MKKFDLIMENWRGFKSLLNEKGTKPHQYPETFEKLRQEVAEEAQANKLYIFLDTETTGLDPQKRYSQITQIAAIKVNPHGFRLGITTDFKSRWFADPKKYVAYLKGDVLIRQYLEKKLRGMYVSTIEIERSRRIGGSRGTGRRTRIRSM